MWSFIEIFIGGCGILLSGKCVLLLRTYYKVAGIIKTNMSEKYGILFVHGIVGNNRIFDFLLPLIPKECAVKYVVLAGHGGNALDFSRASMDLWKRQVAEAVCDMSVVCDKVIAVGHSMGCLLLIEVALRNHVAALFLMNPPLRVRIRPKLFSNSLKVAFGLTDNDEVATAAKYAYGISLDANPLHYYGWPTRYLELFAEIRRIRHLLSNGLPCQSYVVLSSHDEMVSVSSADLFGNSPNIKVVVLPESHHYHYSKTDCKIICDEFRELLERGGLAE